MPFSQGLNMLGRFTINVIICLLLLGFELEAQSLVNVHTIRGQIRPGSIAHSENGLFFAQNINYRNSISVFDRNFKLVKTVNDQVRLGDYGIQGTTGWYQGSPVEAAFTPDGKYAWVCNYQMFGRGFDVAGNDNCSLDEDYDPSFVYKINTSTYAIESVIKVGATPKYLQVSPNGKTLLVTNWCSGDVSIIDLGLEKEINRVFLGQHPRGIAIDPNSRFAYISVSGEGKIAVLRLSDNKVNWIPNVGETPYHLTLAPSGRFLYASLNRSGKVVKIDLVKWKIDKTISTGDGSRGMDISPDGQVLYVVNYNENTLSKIYTKSFEIVETLETNEKPIDVCLDIQKHQVWVACYTGTIMIFKDKDWMAPQPPKTNNNIDNISLSKELSPHPQRSRNIRYSYIPKPAESDIAENPYYYIYQSPEASNPSPYQEKAAYASSSQTTKNGSSGNSQTKPAHAHQADAGRRLYSSRSATAPPSGYYLIVASYSNQAGAMEKVRALKAQGYSQAEMLESEKGFRVSCKRVADIETAREEQEELKNSQKINAWILKQ